jgi:hypothetical protein
LEERKMTEVKGTSPGGRAVRVVKVTVKPGGRVDLWICPPGTPPDSDIGWAIADVAVSDLLAALGQRTSGAK